MHSLISIINIGNDSASGTRKFFHSRNQTNAPSKKYHLSSPVKNYLESIGLNITQTRQYNPDMTDDNGRPILIRAIIDCQYNIVRQLLHDGANPNIRDKEQVPAICYAAMYYKVESDNPCKLFDYFESAHTQFNLMDKHGQNAAFYAQSEATLSQLERHNTLIHSLNCNGQTPLFFVHTKSMVDIFLEKGADINHRDQNGKTVIFGKHNYNLLKYYIQKGADIHALDNFGRTPLFYVQSFDEALCFLALGIDPLIKDYNGEMADIQTHPQSPKYKLLVDKVPHTIIQDIFNCDNIPGIELLYKAGILFHDTDAFLQHALKYGSSKAILCVMEYCREQLIDEAQYIELSDFFGNNPHNDDKFYFSNDELFESFVANMSLSNEFNPSSSYFSNTDFIDDIFCIDNNNEILESFVANMSQPNSAFSSSTTKSKSIHNNQNSYYLIQLRSLALKRDDVELCEFLLNIIPLNTFWSLDECIHNHALRIFVWLLQKRKSNREYSSKYIFDIIIMETDDGECIHSLIKAGITLPALDYSTLLLEKAKFFKKANIIKALMEEIENQAQKEPLINCF